MSARVRFTAAWPLLPLLWTAFAFAAKPEPFLPGEGPRIRRAATIVSLARIRALGSDVASVGSGRSGRATQHPAMVLTPLLIEESRALLSRTPSRYGLFVSIFRTRDAGLVGCMGNIVAGHGSLLAEVEHWTMMALSQDARTDTKRARGPVTVIVSFVEAIEPVADALFVDSLQHGLLLRYQGREELVLPGEARTASYAYGMVLAKLGLPRGARPIGLEAFRVRAVRFGPGRALFAPGRATGG